ncbi:FRG domain-containing protein [Mesorhizobium sp. B1-1-5]|uniref:FRG domain-containing protein n=1 Tax=Mesorhizobium sp. B1-1-5 TaxID=2589979 RepID=UPI00112E960C|nr:FRG domain-containing protein [Mesorhizobium sp. B1-1-5]TPO01479.1 FRG domain-containing protein [Mesorhizobium sp. B1-1-5]
MRIVELKQGSLASLFDLIESQPGDYRHLFRGQANAAWEIIPSLYRVDHLGIGGNTLEESYNLFEASWVNRFFDDGLPYLPTITRSFSNDRILAQHFGLPTRFLDWSRDPLVAAFFAVEDPRNTEDAAIFMILPDAEYLPEQVRSLGPHKAIALRPPAIDGRIIAQKSMFTFHPYGGDSNQPFVPLDQRPDMGNQITTKTGVERGFAKIIIPGPCKRKLRHTLLGIGYDRRNLFPGLDGVGADAGARAKTGTMPH